jgi:hypothetical protein
MSLDGRRVRWINPLVLNPLVHACWEGGGLLPFLWHLACGALLPDWFTLSHDMRGMLTSPITEGV